MKYPVSGNAGRWLQYLFARYNIGSAVVTLLTGAEAPCDRIKNQADVTLTRPADGLQKGTAANRSIGGYACWRRGNPPRYNLAGL
jgi:hypothetical protein